MLLSGKTSSSSTLAIGGAVVATVLIAGFAGVLLLTANNSSGSSPAKQAERAIAQEIAAHLRNSAPALMPGENAVDGVRRFVTDNSIHEVDEIFRGYRGDMALILGKILARARGNGPPPHLECSKRTAAMSLILTAQGIRNRRAYLFSDAFAELETHTFLEVWNEARGKWEIQDPDYALFYIDVATGERVGAERLLREPLDRFLPCKAPNDCGWQHADKLRDFFEAVGFKEEGHHPIVHVNPARFDVNKRFKAAAGTQDLTTFVMQDWGKAKARILHLE